MPLTIVASLSACVSPETTTLSSPAWNVNAAPVIVPRAASTIFGCDLGPNLTTVGSLATILWLLILRQRDVEVSGLDYFKVGVVVTPLMLLAGACTIWLCL